jgi:hypothetical protein
MRNPLRRGVASTVGDEFRRLAAHQTASTCASQSFWGAEFIPQIVDNGRLLRNKFRAPFFATSGREKI